MTFGKGASGGILRDQNGRLIFAYYKEFGDVDVLTTESLSLLHGLELCWEKEVHDLDVEVDSEVLVRMLSSGVLAKWMLCNVLQKTMELLLELSSSVVHVYREANAVADKLAGFHLNGDAYFTTIDQLPPLVKAAIVLDSRELSHFFICEVGGSSILILHEFW